jgi:hypothetical protein
MYGAALTDPPIGFDGGRRRHPFTFTGNKTDAVKALMRRLAEIDRRIERSGQTVVHRHRLAHRILAQAARQGGGSGNRMSCFGQLTVLSHSVRENSSAWRARSSINFLRARSVASRVHPCARRLFPRPLRRKDALGCLTQGVDSVQPVRWLALRHQRTVRAWSPGEFAAAIEPLALQQNRRRRSRAQCLPRRRACPILLRRLVDVGDFLRRQSTVP